MLIELFSTKDFKKLMVETTKKFEISTLNYP